MSMHIVIAAWDATFGPDDKVYGPFDSLKEAQAWVDVKQKQTSRRLIIKPVEAPPK